MKAQDQYVYAVIKFIGIDASNFTRCLADIEFLTIRCIESDKIYIDYPIADSDNEGNTMKLIDWLSTDASHLHYKVTLSIIHEHRIMDYTFESRLIDFN